VTFHSLSFSLCLVYTYFFSGGKGKGESAIVKKEGMDISFDDLGFNYFLFLFSKLKKRSAIFLFGGNQAAMKEENNAELVR